jgi:hypothetical protein
MPYEAQRSSHARKLGKDAISDELVHLDDVTPPGKKAFQRKILMSDFG